MGKELEPDNGASRSQKRLLNTLMVIVLEAIATEHYFDGELKFCNRGSF